MDKIESIIYNRISPLTITGDWAVRSMQLKKEYPELTRADLLFERGREDELLRRVETRLNKPREEVINIIKKEII